MGQIIDRRRGLASAAGLSVIALSLAACSPGPSDPAPVYLRAPSPAAAKAPAPPTFRDGIVTVQAGDTVIDIAHDNHVPLGTLIAANKLRTPYLIHPGDRLTIPNPGVLPGDIPMTRMATTTPPNAPMQMAANPPAAPSQIAAAQVDTILLPPALPANSPPPTPPAVPPRTATNPGPPPLPQLPAIPAHPAAPIQAVIAQLAPAAPPQVAAATPPPAPQLPAIPAHPAAPIQAVTAQLAPAAPPQVAAATPPAPTAPPKVTPVALDPPPKQLAAIEPLPPPPPAVAPPTTTTNGGPPSVLAARNPAAALPLPGDPIPNVALQTSGGRFIWPVHGRILASYGTANGGPHNEGINIAVPLGTPVRTIDSGTVAYVGNEVKGYGNLVLIKHADGWISAYAHLDDITVKKGDTVAAGEVIAKVGNTGEIGEPQLHFELRRGKKPVDPKEFLEPAGSAAAKSAQKTG